MMTALARPGTVGRIEPRLAPPAPLTPELAALALTLSDHETSLWLDPPLAASAEAIEFLRFHTGARLTGAPSEATFGLISDPTAMPPLSGFAQGSDEYPDRSTTLLIAVEEIAPGTGFALTVRGSTGRRGSRLPPLPADFGAQHAANREQFPRGVDLHLRRARPRCGLPRSVRLTED